MGYLPTFVVGRLIEYCAARGAANSLESPDQHCRKAIREDACDNDNGKKNKKRCLKASG
ncbi:MAG: hypothetical protein ACREQ1_06335 [Woeseiaceae bacterium]